MPSLLSKFTRNASSTAVQPELNRSPAHRRARVSSEHSPSFQSLDEPLLLPSLNGGLADSQGLLMTPSIERERRASSPSPQTAASTSLIHPTTTLDTVNNGAREPAVLANTTSIQSPTPLLHSVDSTAALELTAGSMPQEKHRQSASDSSYILQKPLVGSPPQYDNLLNVTLASSSSPLASPSMSAGAGSSVGTPAALPIPSPIAPQKKSSWRRRESSASAKGKQVSHRRIHPSGGLASAIAGTGLSLANTAMQRPITMLPTPPATNNSNVYRSESVNSNGRDRHSQSRKSSASASNGPPDSAVSYRSTTFDTMSTSKDDANLGGSDEDDDEDDDDDDDDEETSQDELDPLANGVAPITGFAVASNKRTADFHALFPTVPEGDYLIDDYGCALQREILIQGRLYISENHLCFHANIFGWTTDLVIPIDDITQIEKKMTAYVIPNAIQVTTYTSKHTFASLLNRDTTYDVLYNIWRSVRPEGSGSPRGSLDMNRIGTNSMGSVAEGMVDSTGEGMESISGISAGPSKIAAENKTSSCACGKAGEHYPELAMDVVVPCEPEKIYNLMFASGFIKDFMREERLADIQISDWTPKMIGSHLLQRNMSYIKPLNGSIGPKQTKCELTDEMLHLDYNDYISMLTTTRTPDVPSGGVFAVKTRTCLMWASRSSTRVIVTTTVEWTGRSFIKGIIERNCIDGQKTYHASLERSMRRYIAENRAEFFPNGLDVESALGDTLVISKDTPPSPPLPPELSSEDIRKAKEKERSQRGLQWALDTAEGTAKVAHQSFWGAIELIKDAWESSSTTAVLWFVVVGLLLSNVWTYYRANRKAAHYARRYKDGSYPYPYPPYPPLREDDVQRAVGESVRDAIRMIEDAVRSGGGGGSSSADHSKSNTVLGAAADLGEEIANLRKKVMSLEERLSSLEFEMFHTTAHMSLSSSSLAELD